MTKTDGHEKNPRKWDKKALHDMPGARSDGLGDARMGFFKNSAFYQVLVGDKKRKK